MRGARVNLRRMDRSIEWNPQALLQAPLFEPLHPVLARLADGAGGTLPTRDRLNSVLSECEPAIVVHGGKPLRFVPQAAGRLPFEAQYEPRCYLRGEVQTRDNNWHDLFNALVWLTFPKAKAAINERHYRSLTTEARGAENAGESGASQRGARRDMLTLLDESGVVVPCADAELEDLLRGFQWKELLWRRRDRLGGAIGFYVFGHGLYEKALQPYVGMTGQGLVLAVEPAFFHWPLARRLEHLDGALAAYLAGAAGLAPRELTPVPVLGVPGWSSESRDQFFYDDSSYFRPGRLSFQRTTRRKPEAVS